MKPELDTPVNDGSAIRLLWTEPSQQWLLPSSSFRRARTCYDEAL